VQIQTAEITLSYGIMIVYSRVKEERHEKLSFGRQKGHSNKNEELYQKG
jgi:hypothetical protein